MILPFLVAKSILFAHASAAAATGSTVASTVVSTPISLKTFQTKPRLVVVMVIDQFRADYLTRFSKRFLADHGPARPGGFNYLMQNGSYFPFADYEVLQNMTCPGHSMILTGARPYSTHIPLNEFMDLEKGRMVPCTQDDNASIVGADAKDKDEFASPVRLKTSTVGDELKNAGFPSRVVTIALKSRAAVMLGGHRADLALWFDSPSLRWVTSRYYIPQGNLPTWVEKLSTGIAARAEQGKYIWKASSAETGYSTGLTEKSFEREIDYHSKTALSTPLGLDITTDAALAAVHEMKLGKGTSPDILALSYSAHDAMGHTWGPNAREMEEMTVAEDQNINRLLKGLASEVPGGLKNVLVVLTADHGMAPAVPYSTHSKVQAIGIDETDIVARANELLSKKFGAPKDSAPENQWIKAVNSLNFYLNHTLIADKKQIAEVVQAELKKFVLAEPGIDTAFTLSEYEGHSLFRGYHADEYLKGYVPGISGDVLAVPQPFSYAGDHPNHMTDYAYDRTVPLIFAGARVKTGVFANQARVVDLAPTLSFILGTIAPASSEGRVLHEILKN